MELIQFIRLFRKWFWLLFLAAFIGGGLSFVINSRRPDFYRTTTRLYIGSSLISPNPNQGDLFAAQQLVDTYAQLVTSTPILQSTIAARNLSYGPGTVGGMIRTRTVSNTSFLDIVVTFTDPIVAAEVANGVAQALIENSPNLTPEQQSQVDFSIQQMASISTQLQVSNQQLEIVDRQLQTVTNPEEIAQLTEQRNRLVDQINQATANIAQFQDTVTRLQERINSLRIIEFAPVPGGPIGNSVMTATIFGGIIGAILAAGVVLLIEYLDDTMATSEEAAQVIGLPVLATIARFGRRKDSYEKRLVSNFPPQSPVSEGYRTLRTNLLYASDEHRKGLYVVTSAGPSEGKSLTTSNLAVTMALAGLRVLLIDADLRRPKVHEMFGLKNDVGLTTLLSSTPSMNGSHPAMDAETGEPIDSLKQCLQTTSIPKLMVITSGFIPKNPTEVLGSVSMRRWIEAFQASDKIDIILIDTPPSLVVADSSVLATTVKADVIFVVEANGTRRAAAIRIKEQFEHLGCNIKGVVLNGINPRDEAYYGYGYYYTYYSQNAASQSSRRPALLKFLSGAGKDDGDDS